MSWGAVGAVLLVCGVVVGRARADQASIPPAAAPTVSAPIAQVGPSARPPVTPVAVDPTVALNPFAIAPRPGVAPLEPEPPAETSQAGDRAPRNNLVFLELGGNGILYTMNYDRAIAGGFTVRVGVGHLAEGANPIAGDVQTASLPAVGAPFLINYVRGRGRHRLEVGAGVTLLYASARASTRYRAATAADLTPLATALIGYRYVPPEGGFTYRAGFTPLVSDAGVLPWGGLSVGYLF